MPQYWITNSTEHPDYNVGVFPDDEHSVPVHIGVMSASNGPHGNGPHILGLAATLKALAAKKAVQPIAPWSPPPWDIDTKEITTNVDLTAIMDVAPFKKKPNLLDPADFKHPINLGMDFGAQDSMSIGVTPLYGPQQLSAIVSGQEFKGVLHMTPEATYKAKGTKFSFMAEKDLMKHEVRLSFFAELPAPAGQHYGPVMLAQSPMWVQVLDGQSSAGLDPSKAPTFAMKHETAVDLMTELWNIGVRPTGYTLPKDTEPDKSEMLKAQHDEMVEHIKTLKIQVSAHINHIDFLHVIVDELMGLKK